MPASSQSGMGARSYSGGVGFRVWAPFAQSVAVIGEFNGWSEATSPLTHEANGYWSTDVPGAVVGQRYKYAIRDSNGNLLRRNDPYAREMTTHPDAANPGTQVTDSLIHEKDFDWTGDAF